MRILHISKYYFPYIGGVENICKYLVEAMPEQESAVVCFNDRCQDIIDEVNGHKIYRVATWVNIARQALSLSYFWVLKKALREFKPDVIQFHWANPFPAAVLLCMIPHNVKLVLHWHMDIIKQKKIYPFIRPIESAILKRANLVVVTSPQYRDASIPLQRFKEKVKILPNAIDVNALLLKEGDENKIIKLKKKYGNKPIVFFVGRHIQYKGLEHLIASETYVESDCVFIIAGEGPLTNALKKQCESSRVYFVGKLSSEDLKLYYYAATVFAFPSITKNEAFGVALAEAMFCGTPPVTFTIQGSGVNWVSINRETGIEVPNGDDIEFAKAIDVLLQNETLRIKYAVNGSKRVKENFTIPVMVKKMKEYYNAILKGERVLDIGNHL